MIRRRWGSRLAYLGWRRRVSWPPSGLWAMGLLFAAFLLLPTDTLGSAFLDRRLMPVLAFIALAFAEARPSQRETQLIVVLAICLVALKFAEVQIAWSETSRMFAQVRTALQQLPRDARVMTEVLMDGPNMEFPPARRVAAFAVIDRAAFAPNLSAYPVIDSRLAYWPEALVMRNGFTDILISSGQAPDWNRVCRQYDAVLIIGRRTRLVTPSCATSMQTETQFELFRIRNPA